MNRRNFLAAATLGLARASSAVAWDRGRGPVTSDIGPLRRVIVHEPGPETRKALTVAGVEHPFQTIDLMGERAAEQHRALVGRLRAGGAEVLEFRELVQSAIDVARGEGAFRDWLESAIPQVAEREAEVDASVLLGAVDEFVYHSPPGEDGVRPLTVPLKFLFYVRDVAVMTPRGIILANLGSRTRAFETVLFQFALRWSPALRPYSVAFDARAERLFLQGGDVIVADNRTLLVGVGNLTEESAARKLAQKLRMDVISVQLPGGSRFRGEGPFGQGNGLRLKFLHLDTIFNLTGPRSAVAVPYFLEAAHAGSDPLTRVLQGMAEQPDVDRAYMERLAASLAQVGNVKRYKARSGDLDPAVQGQKLVDYLRTLGYEITYIGGDPPERDAAKHVVESVLREVRFQGGNVVALAPKRLVACEGNALTLASLRRDGCEALTFPADELVRWHGGAHCMTLPLERGAPS